MGFVSQLLSTSNSGSLVPGHILCAHGVALSAVRDIAAVGTALTVELILSLFPRGYVLAHSLSGW